MSSFNGLYNQLLCLNGIPYSIASGILFGYIPSFSSTLYLASCVRLDVACHMACNPILLQMELSIPFHIVAPAIICSDRKITIALFYTDLLSNGDEIVNKGWWYAHIWIQSYLQLLSIISWFAEINQLATRATLNICRIIQFNIYISTCANAAWFVIVLMISHCP